MTAVRLRCTHCRRAPSVVRAAKGDVCLRCRDGILVEATEEQEGG